MSDQNDHSEPSPTKQDSATPDRSGATFKRRPIRGLVVDDSMQFKLAVMTSGLVFLPTLILGIAMILDTAHVAGGLLSNSAENVEVAGALMQKAYIDCLILLAGFGLLTILSIYLSLRISNRIIGPVARLERHLEGLLSGNFDRKTNLREGDYLMKLSELIDEIAVKMKG